MSDAEIRLNELEARLHCPGLWTCPTCGFTLVKSILYAKSGSVGTDLSRNDEPCPNDGDKMRRVTWEERAKDMDRLSTQLLDRAVDAETALEESVKLQSHYAGLLNQWDGGQRMPFDNADSWIKRLRQLGKLPQRK